MFWTYTKLYKYRGLHTNFQFCNLNYMFIYYKEYLPPSAQEGARATQTNTNSFIFLDVNRSVFDELPN